MLIIKEIQIKTIMRYQLSPVRMAVIKKSKKIANIREDVEKREQLYSFGGNINWCSTMEKTMEVSSKTRNGISICSSNFTPEYIHRENESCNLKNLHALQCS